MAQKTNIRKRPSGAGWEGRYRLDGKRKSVYGKTQSEVERKLRDVLGRIDKGLSVGDKQLTVSKLLDHWLTTLKLDHKIQSVNTIDNYEWAVAEVKNALGHKRLMSLTSFEVENWLTDLAIRGYSRSSLGRFHTTLKKTLRYAVRHGLVFQNVAELVDTPAGYEKPRRSLTVEESKRLLEAARGSRLEVLVTLGLMLGLRPGELTGLRWEDFDRKKGTLKVVRSLKRERGALRLGGTKTQDSVRTIALPPPVMELLSGVRGTGYIAGRELDPSNFRREFKAITEKAGLGKWTPVELRHSAASILSASGVRIEEIMDLMGHRSTRMLEKHYRHDIQPAVTAALSFPTSK